MIISVPEKMVCDKNRSKGKLKVIQHSLCKFSNRHGVGMSFNLTEKYLWAQTSWHLSRKSHAQERPCIGFHRKSMFSVCCSLSLLLCIDLVLCLHLVLIVIYVFFFKVRTDLANKKKIEMNTAFTAPLSQ